MVDMVVFVWRFENGVLYRLDRRMMDGDAGLVMLEIMAAIA